MNYLKLIILSNFAWQNKSSSIVCWKKIKNQSFKTMAWILIRICSEKEAKVWLMTRNFLKSWTIILHQFLSGKSFVFGGWEGGWREGREFMYCLWVNKRLGFIISRGLNWKYISKGRLFVSSFSSLSIVYSTFLVNDVKRFQNNK